MELYDELQHRLRLAGDSIRRLRATGAELAQKEYDYRLALSARLTKLRADGQPVTHLADIARGEPSIAKLRMERDIAQSLYDADREAVQLYKLQIRIIEGQLAREWTQAGKGN